MAEPLVIKFEDFKKLAGNHRVYYYIGDNFYEFVYLMDGVFVKTTVLKTDVENPKQFFSDRLFYGAVQLFFRIPDPKTDITEIAGVKALLEVPIVVQDFQDEETKNTDIQDEGAGSE